MTFTKFLIATSFLALCAFPAQVKAEEPPKWGPQVEVEVKVSNTGRRMAIPKMMVPLWQNEDTLLFTDIRTRQENNGNDEYNAGVGLRKIITLPEVNEDVIIGGFTQFDRLRSENGNYYNQATFGVELLSENFDIRGNLYRPEGRKYGSATPTDVEVVGNNFFLVGGQEQALPGYDYEVGFKLPVDYFDVRAYAGAFNFDDEGTERIAGPRGRLELTLTEEHVDFMPLDGMEVSFGFEAQHDDVRGSQKFGLL